MVKQRVPVNSNINYEVLQFGKLISYILEWVSAQSK